MRHFAVRYGDHHLVLEPRTISEQNFTQSEDQECFHDEDGDLNESISKSKDTQQDGNLSSLFVIFFYISSETLHLWETYYSGTLTLGVELGLGRVSTVFSKCQNKKKKKKKI